MWISSERCTYLHFSGRVCSYIPIEILRVDWNSDFPNLRESHHVPDVIKLGLYLDKSLIFRFSPTLYKWSARLTVNSTVRPILQRVGLANRTPIFVKSKSPVSAICNHAQPAKPTRPSQASPTLKTPRIKRLHVDATTACKRYHTRTKENQGRRNDTTIDGTPVGSLETAYRSFRIRRGERCVQHSSKRSQEVEQFNIDAHL
jgi:hypothetical protein